MRKWTLAVVVAGFFASALPASAQSAVGVRAGARWSGLETSQDVSSIRTMIIGGYLGFGITSRLALQFEGVYGTRGARGLRLGADVLDSGASPARLEMDYFEVPVLLRAAFPYKRVLPSLFLGPYVGFLLNCEIQPAGEDARECDTPEAPQRFTPRSTDYGLIIGGGFDVAMGRSTIFLDTRYSLGLNSVESGDETFDARHGGIAVSLGFAVPLGR
jgi:hypothetical protein